MSWNPVTNHVNPQTIKTLQAMLVKMDVRTESRDTDGVLCSLLINSAYTMTDVGNPACHTR